jgi:hypothetical protein
LHFAFAIKETATTGVESFIIFHHHNGGFYGVQGGAAQVENLPPGSDGVTDAIQVGFDHVVGNRPCPAVNE